jgi:hypothetical protein
MAKAQKGKNAPAKGKPHNMNMLAHPATTEMLSRVGGCGKPPIIWLKQGDGSWLECFLRPDCTYGNCHEVPASTVPASLRGG